VNIVPVGAMLVAQAKLVSDRARETPHEVRGERHLKNSGSYISEPMKDPRWRTEGPY